jgi:hypothetical protein
MVREINPMHAPKRTELHADRNDGRAGATPPFDARCVTVLRGVAPATPSYAITEALKVLFKRDGEFKAWLGQQSVNGKIHQVTGGGLKETA